MGVLLDYMTNYYGVDEFGVPLYNIPDAPMPAAEYSWMIAIIIIALIALWQARTFMSQF